MTVHIHPENTQQQVSFTCFTKTKGILTKRMKLADGQLVKDSSGCRMSRGRAETVTLGLEQFGEYLQGLKPSQAIAHGICEHSKALIVSKAKETGARAGNGLPIIARSKKHFRYPAGPGLLMLDHDKARDNAVSLDAKALQAYSPDKLVEIISDFFPKIKEAAYLSSCSTSSCIYNTETGEELRGKGAGFHLYLFPKNAADVPRFLAVLGKRLVLAGYGRVEISRAGSLLERTLADLLVGSPERLDFVAGAVCDKGLEQRRPEPEYHQGGLLDTAKLPDLTAEEEAAYQEIIRQLKEKAQPAQEQIKSAYLEQEAEKLAKESGGRISLEQARETVKARQSHVMADADLLHFAHQKEPVSVAHALNNGPEFNGKACADPLEPEYNGSRSTAKFYWNDGKKPLVQSYAHGDIQYTFSRFAEAAENKKKPVEVWSFANVQKFLEQEPEKLKELTAVQKHELAEEILSHNSFRSAELNAVKDMLKEHLGIAKGEQEQVLRAERKKEAARKTTSFSLLEDEGKGGVRLIAQNRAAMFLAETMEGKYAVWPESMKWYEFAGTHWKECQKGEFEEEASRIFNEESGSVGYSDNYFVGSTNILRRLGKLKVNDEDKGKIPFANGILDLNTMKLEKTTHHNALKWHIPYHYEQESKCDGFLGWLDQACQDESKGLQKMIRATINLCLQSRKDLQYFIHLKGKPGTGKGTLSRLLQKMVGEDGFASSDIELLNSDKFEAGNYFDKRLLIFDEIPSHVPIKKFLRLTGRDPMRREGKYEKAASPFIYDGVVLLLGNDYFSTDDQTSFAAERRRITILFDKVFSTLEKKIWREMGGEDALHEEIPGIINWALQMTKEEVSECFDDPPEKVVKANKEAEAVNSPIVEFMEDHVEYDVTGKVQVGTHVEMRGMTGEKIFKDRDTKLFPRYLHWFLATGKKPIGRTKFVEAFMNAANRHLLPAPDAGRVERSKTKYNGNYPLLGIRLVPWSDTEFYEENEEEEDLGSLGSSETRRY